MEKWSEKIKETNNQVLKSIIKTYCKDHWKDEVKEHQELEENKTVSTKFVYPKNADPKVEKCIHFKVIERLMEELFPLPVLDTVMDNSDIRFDNYLKIIGSKLKQVKTRKPLGRIEKF